VAIEQASIFDTCGQPKQSGAGFSLRGLVLARPKTRSLKPAPRNPAAECRQVRDTGR